MVVTIQQTSKTWKGLWLLAYLGIWVGLGMLIYSLFNTDVNTGIVGMWLLQGGILVHIIAKLGAWWYHG